MPGRTGLQGLFFPLDLRVKPEDDKSTPSCHSHENGNPLGAEILIIY